MRLDGWRKEKTTLYLILSVQLSDRSKCLSHAAKHTECTHFSRGWTVKYVQSKPINLCNCGFGLQLVSKTLYTAENIVWFFRQIPFRSTCPWSVLRSRSKRCLTEPNNGSLNCNYRETFYHFYRTVIQFSKKMQFELVVCMHIYTLH